MKVNVGPRIEEKTKDFILKCFENPNSGATYLIESFPNLYRITLLELKGLFETNELKLIIDVYNGHMINNEMAGQALYFGIHDGCFYDCLDSKWEIDKEKLLKKIDKLTIYQKACIEIWANGFWYGGNNTEKKPLDLDKHVAALAIQQSF